MLENVVILGGNTQVPGFDSRVASELKALNNVDATIRILNEYQYKNLETPSDFQVLDDRAIHPWLGAAKQASLWQEKGQILDFALSRQQYEEMGAEYLKDHPLSNVFAKTI